MKTEIARYIQPESHIISYVWNGYSVMDELNLEIGSRDIIIPQKKFVNPAFQEQLRVFGIYLLRRSSFTIVIMLSCNKGIYLDPIDCTRSRE